MERFNGKKEVLFKIVVLFLFFPLCFSAIGEEDYGCRWVSTLNFTATVNIPDIEKKTDPKKIITTGEGGNTSLIETILNDKQNPFRIESFDVIRIHQGLKKSTLEIGDHNSVAAGLSLIFHDPVKEDKNFVVCFEPFKEKNKTISFLSGSCPPSRPEEHIMDASKVSPNTLLKRFGKRLEEASSIIGKPISR
ncbi:MAG: hypothetical protein A2977_00745 [Alphaproteobacteria bacterium RIFCSPLOWO2_01_FULL_45_8]|nr:MAG: hypothetical protein A2065_03630 [Alphaproteobacteria bacterium GWB1_45_5]OFW96621.1 MAG: hypothetical protein A2977_00745 [Alphaproteobacteria bacterium RIFCSPLOWO2_01_FULL_45_8]